MFYVNNGVLPDYPDELALLISQCQARGVKKINLATGSEAEMDRIITFMNAYPATRITGIWIEHEWWRNNPRDFDHVLELITYIDENTPYPIELGCYIGSANEAEMLALARLVDRIFIHAYVTNASSAYTYTKTRLSYLTDSAYRAKILPLFSAESNFMGPWYTANSILAAERQYRVKFNQDKPKILNRVFSRTWRDNMQLTGFYIYGWTHLKLAMGVK